jgi:hypothetical protein
MRSGKYSTNLMYLFSTFAIYLEPPAPLPKREVTGGLVVDLVVSCS